MNEALSINRNATLAFRRIARRATAGELHRNAGFARSRAIAAAIGSALVSMYAVLHSAYASYRAYRDARETMAMLRGLDDRTLHDLGYDRSQIESVAIEACIARMK